MSTECERLVTIYDCLSQDPDILEAMGLTGELDQLIQTRICKSKQFGNVTDDNPRIAIWEGTPRPQNEKVNTHRLNLDIVVPLESQRSRGLALAIADLIKVCKALKSASMGTGLHYVTTKPDQQTAIGWYKATVVYTYNYIEK